MTENGKLAVITGASSGIGEATARQLAGEGFRLVLVARRRERLEALLEEITHSRGEASALAANLADETEYQRVFDEVRVRHGPADILINNAGIGWYGFSSEMPWALARQMIGVNMIAVARLTLLFLADMRGRNRGHIINVGSIAGSIPSQGVALYSATKSFVDALTTSIYRELRGTRVRVSVVRAGAVATPFFDAAERHNGLRVPVDWLAIRPEVVARRISQLIRKPTRIAYVPRVLAFVPWLELSLGWLMDRIGPQLLRYQMRRARS